MYRSRLTLTGIEETVTNNIAISVLKDVQKLLGLRKEVPIRIGDNAPLYISTQMNGSQGHTPDILDDVITADYNETSTEGYDLSLNSLAPHGGYIYSDPDVNASAVPLRCRRTMSFTIGFYSKSKSKVTAMLNRLRSRNASDTRHRMHDLEYFYYIPDILLELLDEINTLKNTYTVPPVDLDDYAVATFDDSADMVNSETGNNLKSKLVIREYQKAVLGTIDTDVQNIVKEKDDETGRWGFTIDYSIEYEMTHQLLVTYPITVYNQPIPAKFRIKKKVVDNNSTVRTNSEAGLNYLAKNKTTGADIANGDYYIKIPSVDNMDLGMPVDGYVRLFSTLAVITPNDPTGLFYLDELPGITFKPEVLELIKLESSKMGDTHTSIFYMDIYDHDKIIYGNKIVVSPVTEIINGVATDRIKITTLAPLSIKGCYRVCFNILTDVGMIRVGGLSSLKDNVVIVDSNTTNDFSVIDTVFSIFDLDVTKLRSGFDISDPRVDSFDIAANIDPSLPLRIYRKQVSLVLTDILK